MWRFWFFVDFWRRFFRICFLFFFRHEDPEEREVIATVVFGCGVRSAGSSDARLSVEPVAMGCDSSPPTRHEPGLLKLIQRWRDFYSLFSNLLNLQSPSFLLFFTLFFIDLLLISFSLFFSLLLPFPSFFRVIRFPLPL